MPLNIRRATPEDTKQIYQYICDLAEYEKALDEVKCNEASLKESLFGQPTVAYALMIEDDDEAIGYAIYFYNYSTWLAAKGLYLEDLYVDPRHRGKGAGIAMMKALAGIAQAQNCGRFEWSVLDWNTPSIEFYEAIGAKAQNEWLGYRLEGEALATLAD